MGTLAFLFAIWGLLLTPGPTNTLLALSGASAGLARSVRLMPAELCAYLLVTVPLAVFGAEFLAREPLVASAVKLAAAGWVAVLAVKLWRIRAEAAEEGAVTARRVFVTTLLNPKGLIIGLTLLPRGAAPEFPLHLGLFAASILGVALIWAGGGAVLNRGKAGTPILYRRAAALWLAFLAVALAGAAIRA
ncbi:hypothetical protein V5F59_19205 [Xanthobacter autotrophicus DSM 431]|uniref:LysE family translocator n=1 Tax=Xanthobacter nonsaccharivorans TaxID=3119912 RepID=UPI00372AD9F3